MKCVCTLFATCLLLLSGAAAAQQDAAQQVAAQPVSAQQTQTQARTVDPRKLAVIRQLLEVTGSINLANQVMSRLFDAQKKAHPEIDAAVWDRIASKMDANDMRAEVIDIYDRHFSTEDLQATLAFYQSVAGQRLLKELPAVMSEAMTVGQAWGQRKADELRIELQNEKEHPSRRE